LRKEVKIGNSPNIWEIPQMPVSLGNSPNTWEYGKFSKFLKDSKSGAQLDIW